MATATASESPVTPSSTSPSARRKAARAEHDEALAVAQGVTSPQLLSTQLVPLAEIVDAGPLNQAKVNELVESMKGGVQQQPIMIFRELGSVGKFRTVFGFHRRAAAKKLGWETVLAIVLDHVPPAAELHRLRAVENLHRRGVGALEEIKIVKEMLDIHGGDVQRVAVELACKVSWVEDRKYFQRLCPGVQEMVERGEVALGHAREIAKLGDPKDQLRVAEDVQIVPNKQHQRVYTNEEVANMVRFRTKSLKIVPWTLEQPVFNKPACVGCPHNSTTDKTLFGIEGGGPGFCLNEPCFEHKSKAAEKARDSAIQKMTKQRMEPTAENVRAVAPESLKFESLQRAAKKELGETKGAAGGGGGGGKQTAAAKPKTDKERRQEALLKWGMKFNAWRLAVAGEIESLHKKRPLVFLVQTFVEQTNILWSLTYDVPTQVHELGQYGQYKDDVKPRSPKVTPPNLARIIDLLDVANLHTAEAIEEIAQFAVNAKTQYGGKFSRLTEDATLRLAKTFGVKVDPAPVFEDFLPADLKPAAKNGSAAAPASKPAAKSKAKGSKPAKAAAVDAGDDDDEEGAGSVSLAAMGESIRQRCLRRAMLLSTGAEGRWKLRRENGLTDVELRAAIGSEFPGVGSCPSNEDSFQFAMRGGNSPAIWFGKLQTVGQPDLYGKALVDAVRTLMQIPLPGAVDPETEVRLDTDPGLLKKGGLVKVAFASLIKRDKKLGVFSGKVGKIVVIYRRKPNDCGQSVAVDINGEVNDFWAHDLLHVPQCRVCGCWEEDCRECIEATGHPCHWVKPDLCSRCAPAGLPMADHAPVVSVGELNHTGVVPSRTTKRKLEIWLKVGAYVTVKNNARTEFQHLHFGQTLKINWVDPAGEWIHGKNAEGENVRLLISEVRMANESEVLAFEGIDGHGEPLKKGKSR